MNIRLITSVLLIITIFFSAPVQAADMSGWHSSVGTDIAIANNESTSQSYTNMLKTEPRYFQTNNWGTYVAYGNKLYQMQATGNKLVLDLGTGTTARDTYSGLTIEDFSSFYITDLAPAYDIIHGESIFISGLVLAKFDGVAYPTDVYMMYWPDVGRTRTYHVNIRHSIPVSKDQLAMKESVIYDYTKDILWPRAVIGDNANLMFVLSGAANLELNSMASASRVPKDYDGSYFELVELDHGDVESRWYGPLYIFDPKINPHLKTEQGLNNKAHIIDPRLIVFKKTAEVNGEFVIASVGTDDSDVCTAITINIVNQTPYESYWIERTKFFELMQ